MGDLVADLRAELAVLRKGRGLETPRITDQVGVVLRHVCTVAPEDPGRTVRTKVALRLEQLIGELPEDLALAVSVALALHPDARQPFLEGRMSWLAERLRRDVRTARRRVDDGFQLLAELAADSVLPAASAVPATPEPPALRGPERRDDDWHVRSLHAVLRLDGRAPEAYERREVVARRDGLDRIDVLVTLPRDPSARETGHELGMDVLYGGTLVKQEHDTDSRFRFVLQLPAALRAGQRHEYAVVFRVGDGQPMRSHYVFVSRRPCDLFDLRIRFDRRRLPEQAWLVREAFHRTLDDAVPGSEIVTPDRAGELHLSFTGVRPGFGYGVQWREGPAYELGAPAARVS
jgi:hypothetical protein